MDNNGYYNGKHSFMLPPVNYQIQYDSFTDYQASSQVQQQQPQQQQQQQQQQHQQLPHQVQTTHQQHHDIQSTISVKLDTINKSPSQKNDEIQACSGGYTGNNSATSANDFHGNLYHYNKNLDNSDGVAAYNQTSVVSNYSDFDHIGGSSIGQKSLSSFLLPQQHQQQQHQHQPHNQQQTQQVQQVQQQQQHQTHIQHPPTAAIIPQAIGNVQNDISQQSKVLGTFDQRTSSKCYNSKSTTATNSLHGYQQSGYKESEMPFNFNKLPPIPQTYHHVYPTYDKYSLQPRPTSHHKSYDDNPSNSRPYVCQTMPMATNHKPTSQSELFCSSSATAEQHNRFSNRNYLIPNSAFTTPANGYFTPMYHRSNNVHRNLSLPPPLQPAIDDSSNYYHNNNLLLRGGTPYNRSQMAFQQTHYPYARSHHPMQMPKLQSKSDIDIMSGLAEDIYHRPYSYDHYDDFQFSQVPPNVTHYPTKSSKVIYAPYSSNSVNAYPPSTVHQQTLSTAQHQQQQHHNIQPQQHHQSVIQNQVLSANDYSRYTCSNVQPSSVNCSNKIYLQDQYSYATHPQMIYSHGTSEVAQTELPKYNQIYDKHTTLSSEKLALDIEDQITGSKILKTRDVAPTSSYDCSKSNYNKDQYIYNYNAINNSYQQLRGSAEQDASKNQSIRDYLATWNDDEEEEGDTIGGGKKPNSRRIAAVDVMSRSCGQSQLEMDGASNVSTTKIHFGIKVDNGGMPTKNLPDIIIDIEKPKVVGSDESYSSVTDKLYVLESIDVPISDLNKYKHLNVVNKLPDNIVQIDRRKGDSLEDVEETLKLIEKCEEPIRLHKSDFELDVKYEGEACASPIRGDCRSDVGHEEDTMLNDPLSIHEIPMDADQHTVPAPSPTIEKDEENSSNAHDKTADDGQEDGDADEEEEIETMNDGDGEVVRYKCVQKKVSTNSDELIHSDVSIPKLKIKIMRRKRSKSFRSRKIRNCSDSFDTHGAVKLMHLDDATSHVKTLKLICLDVINTIGFRKYLISMKNDESLNVLQYSRQTSIENDIECLDRLENDGELIKESVEPKNNTSDLIENKNFSHSPPPVSSKISDDERELSSSNISSCAEETDKSHEKLKPTFDNDDPSDNQSPSKYDCFPPHDRVLDDSDDDHSLDDFNFHTPSVGDDFVDPHFEANLGADLLSVPIKSNDASQEIEPFFPLNNVDYINENECTNNIKGNTNTNEQNIERIDKSTENIMDSQSVESLIDNLEKTQSVPSNRVEVSELIDSLDDIEELIGSSGQPLISENHSDDIIVKSCPVQSTNSNETQVSAPIDSKDELNALESMTNVFKTEPIKSEYSDSSSSSCSSSDDSNDSFQGKVSEMKREDDTTSIMNTDRNNVRASNSSSSSDSTSVTNTDCNNVRDSTFSSSSDSTLATNTDRNNTRVSNYSSSSSDESEDLDDKSSDGSSLRTVNPNNTHTDSEGLYSKTSSNESDANEPKVKIENEETLMHSKSDDQISHSSDNGFKSSSYSGSSSDNSDESSTDSDDENASDSVPRIEKTLPQEDSLFVARKIKTEETSHQYSDTTDESSIESCDETESETAIKDVPTHDNESVESSSSSETSDDEYVSRSPIKSVLVENEVESSKTSSDTELSEEEDKKSCSSSPSSKLSVHEKHEFSIERLTEPETGTDCTAIHISIPRKNSPTNSDERYVEESVDIRSKKAHCEKQVIEDFIKTEPISEETRGFNSSSDNSDDEYVKLSPLNTNLLDECPRTDDHLKNLSQLPIKNVVLNPERSKKQILSSDGYSTSTSSSSSSSSSQSSSSDEYSSDDDDVFQSKPTLAVRDVDNKIDSIELEPIKAIKTEVEVEAEGPINQEQNEYLVEQSETLSEVEEQTVHELGNDLSLDTLSNNHTESGKNVEAVTQNDDPSSTEFGKDTLLVNAKCSTEKEHHNSSDILSNDISVDDNLSESKLIQPSERINSNLEEFDDDDDDDDDDGVNNCSATDDENGRTEMSNNFVPEQNTDIERPSDGSDTEAESCQTSVAESIECSSEQQVIISDEVNSKTSINNDIEDSGSVEPENENQVVQQNIETLIADDNDDPESNATVPHVDSKMDTFDTDVSKESHEQINTDSQMVSAVENISSDVCNDETLDQISFVQKGDTETTTNHHHNINDREMIEAKTINTIETSFCNQEKEANATLSTFGDKVEASLTETEIFSQEKEKEANATLSTLDNKVEVPLTETEIISHVIESTNQNSTEENSHSVQINEAVTSPTTPKDSIYPVLDIPVKLIPLPGEQFNEELYQKLIDNSEIFPSRKTVEIVDLDDFYSKIPVELIPLPGETIDEKASHFIEFKRKYFDDLKSSAQVKLHGNSFGNVRNQEGTGQIRQSEIDHPSFSSECLNKNTLVINDPIPSLKVLCEKVLGVAGLHYDEDDESETVIDGDNENISYLYIMNDDDDFWNCSNDSTSPLIVCYDGELDDDVFVESDFSALPDPSSENLANMSEKCSITSQTLSVDSFTIDSHDIQYEEIVPVNRTMYKLETFKRYLQSKYIQKPNYIQIHCINKILKKYSNYQRYRKKHVQATVQKCKNRIENFKNLIKYPNNNETSLHVTDRFTVNDNVPKNDVLRSNCDINKSKLLLLTTNNNNIKSKRNLNSTQRNHKLKKSEVSTISSYVSEMTKNNHLKESRAFAKEIITNNKRSIKSNAKVTTTTATPIDAKSKISKLSHSISLNQIAIPKRKVSDSIVEPMITRNNKKRKLSFDDTLLGINRIYKQISLMDDCDKIEVKPSSSSNKLKERSNVYSNSNILNNSKDKVRRLIIPKSKIFDGSSTKSNFIPVVQVPFVKLVRNPYIDNLSKSYVNSTFKYVSRK